MNPAAFELGELTSIICSAFFTDASVSKEKRASTSVDTRPGIIFKISLPN
jgi:hypothetical protein